MPNYCTNDVYISGDETSIEKIKFALESIEDKTEGNVFTTLVGIKPDVTFAEYETEKWYDANISYWGTKWDVSHEDLNVAYSDTGITMSFLTAWSPPIQFFYHLCKQYNVKVEIYYEEPGANFAGKTIIEPEGIVSEEDYSYEEGKYRLTEDESFFDNVENSIEFALQNDKTLTVEKFLEDYEYVDEDDKQEIIKLFNEKLKENGEED